MEYFESEKMSNILNKITKCNYFFFLYKSKQFVKNKTEKENKFILYITLVTNSLSY